MLVILNTETAQFLLRLSSNFGTVKFRASWQHIMHKGGKNLWAPDNNISQQQGLASRWKIAYYSFKYVGLLSTSTSDPEFDG